MSAKNEIIKSITNMVGKYSAYEIFSDWVECSALAMQNSCYLIHNELWQNREKQYASVINKYEEKERIELARMFKLLVDALEENIEDVLGDVFMKSGCGSKHLGQFFTPFNLSKLTASLNIPKDISEDNVYYINEPSTGGGGMIIAAASVLKDRGINYQRCMEVVAQDLDWKGVYMSYLQFSLLGIKATVVQGDTLCNPYIEGNYPPERVLITPIKMGVLM